MSKWKMVRLGEVLDYEQPTKYIVESTDYNDCYCTPVLTAGQTFILGYTDESDNVFKDNLPVIIFDDFTTAIKYVNFPFKVKSSAMKILKAKKEIAHIKYLFYCMSIIKVDTQLHKRYWISKYTNIEIPLPPIEEQKRIADILDKASSLIDLRKQQLEKMDLLIKSKFIDMFGDPVINPKGWDMKRISDVCIINPRKTELGSIPDDLEVSFIPMASVSEKGDIRTNEIKKYSEVKTGFTYFHEGDVLFAKITPCMENGKGAIAINLKNLIGFGSTEFHVIRPIENITNSEWIFNLICFKWLREDAEKNMTGSAGQRRVPASYFEKCKVSVPPIELQNQFAKFVEQVEKQKAVMQQSLEKMETNYKALMQEYFG